MDPTVNGIARRVAEMLPMNRSSIGVDSYRGLARHLPQLAETINAHDAEAARGAYASPEMPPLPTAAMPVDPVPRLSGKAMAGMARQMVAMQQAVSASQSRVPRRAEQAEAEYREAVETLPDRELAAKKTLPLPETPDEQTAKETAKRRLVLKLSKVGRHPRFMADLDEYGVLPELQIKKLRAKTYEQLLDLRNEVREVLTHVEAPSLYHYAIDYGSRAVEALTLPLFSTWQITPLNGFHDAVMSDDDLARLKDLVALESDDFGSMDPRFGMASRVFQIGKGVYDRNTKLLKAQIQSVPVGDLEEKYADLDQ